MNNTTKLSNIVFTVYILFAFYVFGGGMVDSLVVFRTWKYIGPSEFPLFHQSDNAHIIPVFVSAFFFSFIPQILLFWFRPPTIPKWMVFASLLLNATMLLSSITIQIPIQMELDKRFSIDLINRLIITDMRYRVIPMILLAGINFMMLYKVVSRNSRSVQH